MPADSWLIGNIPGHKRAIAIENPKIVSELVKRKRSLLIAGHEVSDIAPVIVKLAEKISTVATAHAVKLFIEQGFENIASMTIVDITNRLKDPLWKGLDGKGPYELILTIGIPYYLQSQILSTLKHFAPFLKSISLDRFYQPNADWSFPNVGEEEWRKSLELISAFLSDPC